MDRLGGPFGVILGVLERSWRPLGRLGGILGASWGVLRRLGRILDVFEASWWLLWGVLGADLGASWRSLGVLGASCARCSAQRVAKCRLRSWMPFSNRFLHDFATENGFPNP